jgi:protein FrlC
MSKLLMNQLAATNMVYAHFSFDYFLDSMERLGVHRLELYGCSSHFHFYDSSEDPTPAMKKKLRERGFQVVSMMPEENTYAVNIAAPEANIRDKTVALYKLFIEAASEMECPQMLLCPGRPYWDKPFSVGYRWGLDSVEKLVRHAERYGVTLMYENLNPRESLLAANRFDQFRMVQEIDSPFLKCCVDTVPVACAGETLEQYFELMGDKLAHIHLNDGRPTGHMKWGDGFQDLDAHLNAMRRHGYTGTITMEMANGAYQLDPEPHYRANIETLRRHFDGGELV